MNNMEYFNQKSFLRIPSTHYMKTYTWVYYECMLNWWKSKFINIDISILRGSYDCCSQTVNLMKKYVQQWGQLTHEIIFHSTLTMYDNTTLHKQ